MAVFGAAERPAVATGAMAATATLHVARGDLAPGAAGLAEVRDTVAMLHTLATCGVKPVRFEGVSTFV